MSDTPRARPAFRVPGPLLGLLAVLLVFVVLLGARGQLGTFVRLENLQVMLHKSSIQVICALGLLMVIVSGGIDLSVGAVVALVTVVGLQTYRLVFDGPEYVVPSFLPADWVTALREGGYLRGGTGSVALASLAAVTAGVLTGGLCGLTNGLVITRLRVTPFVATLGMMSLARGLAIWLAGRTRVSFRGARPGWVDSLSRASSDWLIFDPGVWGALVLAACVLVLMRLTVFGRHVHAIGSNEATARLCGIAVGRQKVWVYTLAGLLAGVAGVVMLAHINGGDPNVAQGLELEVIAAVVIGGASLTGGQGGVAGTLLGVMILGLLENGVSQVGVPVEVKYILIGVIVVLNTALARWDRPSKLG